MTAYAALFLHDAREFIDIDASVIREAQASLAQSAQSDGRWIAQGWDHREDARRSMLLTAYTVRALLLDRTEAAGPNDTGRGARELALQRAMDFLKSRAHEFDEPYLIASYALALLDAGDASSASAEGDRLRSLALRQGDTSYWSLETNTPFYGWGLAGRIETTALVLQALAKIGKAADSSAQEEDLISRGLLFVLRSQDRYGIWFSTRATVTVLQAVSELTVSATLRPPGHRSRQSWWTARK